VSFVDIPPFLLHNLAIRVIFLVQSIGDSVRIFMYKAPSTAREHFCRNSSIFIGAPPLYNALFIARNTVMM